MPMNEDPDDYAHDLHVLLQISPAWNVWRPHEATLSVLSRVLSRLQSGRLRYFSSSFEEGMDQEEDPEAAMHEAIEIARRIHRRFPQTVRWLFEWEREDRYRVSRAEFFDRHTEQSVSTIQYN